LKQYNKSKSKQKCIAWLACAGDSQGAEPPQNAKATPGLQKRVAFVPRQARRQEGLLLLLRDCPLLFFLIAAVTPLLMTPSWDVDVE
jgi:hypothetical protein